MACSKRLLERDDIIIQKADNERDEIVWINKKISRTTESYWITPIFRRDQIKILIKNHSRVKIIIGETLHNHYITKKEPFPREHVHNQQSSDLS